MRFIVLGILIGVTTTIYTQINRPQTPKAPFPYNSEELTIWNPQDSLNLSGTLTLPTEGENFPRAILISGGGETERDQEYYGHKPFLVIADYLTRNGIAVFRYDDRGVGKSTGNHKNSTTLDFARDTEFIVKYLKTHKLLNPEKIGLIGHSEGAMIAQIVSSTKENAISFVVLMAGPGEKCSKVYLKQQELVHLSIGRSKKETNQTVSIIKKAIRIICADKNKLELKDKLNTHFTTVYKKHKDPDQKDFSSQAEYVDYWVDFFSSEWAYYFFRFEPALYIKNVECPVLVLNGEMDVQVSFEQNFPAIEKALIKGGNSNYLFKSFPHVNHVFQSCKSGSIYEYETSTNTIAPEVLSELLTWITTTVKN